MNLRDLHYLVALARHRHFGRAAESCHVSQPTLSAQLKKLEEFLGVQLVERTNKQVMLTPIGEDVATRARYILSAADDIVQVSRAAGDPTAGEFRLALIPTVAPYLLPHLVPALRLQLPKLRPMLYEEQTVRLLDRLRRGEVDAGILAIPVDGVDSFAQAALYEEPFLLATPSGQDLGLDLGTNLGPDLGHGPGKSGGIELERLTGERLLLLEEGHCLRDQALDICKMVGAREEREFRATSLETLRQMVAAGAGITLLPELAAFANAAMPNAGAIDMHRFRDPQPTRTIALVWRKGSAREPTMQAIADMVRELDPIAGLG